MPFSAIFTKALRTGRRTDGPTDGRTDGPMDGWTDTPSYRDARTHLKMWSMCLEWCLAAPKNQNKTVGISLSNDMRLLLLHPVIKRVLKLLLVTVAFEDRVTIYLNCKFSLHLCNKKKLRFTTLNVSLFKGRHGKELSLIFGSSMFLYKGVCLYVCVRVCVCMCMHGSVYLCAC